MTSYPSSRSTWMLYRSAAQSCYALIFRRRWVLPPIAKTLPLPGAITKNHCCCLWTCSSYIRADERGINGMPFSVNGIFLFSSARYFSSQAPKGNALWAPGKLALRELNGKLGFGGLLDGVATFRVSARSRRCSGAPSRPRHRSTKCSSSAVIGSFFSQRQKCSCLMGRKPAVGVVVLVVEVHVREAEGARCRTRACCSRRGTW